MTVWVTNRLRTVEVFRVWGLLDFGNLYILAILVWGSFFGGLCEAVCWVSILLTAVWVRFCRGITLTFSRGLGCPCKLHLSQLCLFLVAKATTSHALQILREYVCFGCGFSHHLSGLRVRKVAITFFLSQIPSTDSEPTCSRALCRRICSISTGP